MLKNDLILVGPFKQLVTMSNLPLKGVIKDQQLELIENAGVVSRNGWITEIGPYKELHQNYPKDQCTLDHILGSVTAFPGIIDAHTHLCFAGSRAMDFAARNSGISYLDIAKAGGGIWSTVTNTRNATTEDLARSLNARMDKLLSQGITTVEIKSGYGLDLENELKILRTIKSVGNAHRIDVIACCLAAHMLPKDFGGNENSYLDFILNSLLPKIEEEGLANRFDIFIEESAFSVEAATKYLSILKQKGKEITAHGDQFSVGGSKVAVDCGALSVDHLEVSGDEEIKFLSKSNVTAIALPGASIGLGCNFAPARKLLDAGCSLAIASDWNPGSGPQGDLLTQAGILASFEKLSSAEVWAGIGFRAAKALNLKDRGILNKGMLCDIVAFPCSDYREVLYHQGSMKAVSVWKKGKRIQ